MTGIDIIPADKLFAYLGISMERKIKNMLVDFGEKVVFSQKYDKIKVMEFFRGKILMEDKYHEAY